jgi:hypothetical protein
MFDTQQKSTGTGHTLTVALLAVAFVFIPAVSVMLWPLGYLSASLAIVCSLLCVTLAWLNWKKFSALSIPSIVKSNARVGTIGILCCLMGTPILHAGDFSSYRGFQFGMSLSAAAKQSGTINAEARLVHQSPALIQEIDWLPIASSHPTAANADPVKDGVLCFYNGELSRIIVNYSRYKVEGMTPNDMVEAISATYGLASRPTAEIANHSVYGEVVPVIARWEDAQYAYNLVQTGDRSSFAMVMYSKRLDGLAQAAIADAVRLEAQEAPQKEIERQAKRDQDERAALDKARSVNKPNFRP